MGQTAHRTEVYHSRWLGTALISGSNPTTGDGEVDVGQDLCSVTVRLSSVEWEVPSLGAVRRLTCAEMHLCIMPLKVVPGSSDNNFQ